MADFPIVSFQKEVGEVLIYISEFLVKINPNPIVAVSAFDIVNNHILNKYILGKEIKTVKITTREVKELYDQLWEFFDNLELYHYPDVAIAAFEITKYQFIQEVVALGQKKKK